VIRVASYIDNGAMDDDDERLQRMELAEDLQTTMAVFTAVLTEGPDPAAVDVALDNARDAGLTDLRLVRALLIIARSAYNAAAMANGTTAEEEIQKEAAAIALMVERYRGREEDEGSS
jgi:alkylhydroperoxidase family enzyme